MIPPLATTLDALERLLAAATPGPWNHDHVGGIVGVGLRAVTRSHFLARPSSDEARSNYRLIVAAVNALPALIAAARAALPSEGAPAISVVLDALTAKANDGRWHPDYRRGIAHAVHEIGATAAQPAPATEALRLLRELVQAVNDLEKRSVAGGGQFHVWIEERNLTAVRDEARRYLAATEEGT